MAPPSSNPDEPQDPELKMAEPKPEGFKTPEKFPDMPWKKNKKVG